MKDKHRDKQVYNLGTNAVLFFFLRQQKEETLAVRYRYRSQQNIGTVGINALNY